MLHLDPEKIETQVGGLQDTFLAVSVLVALGLGLSVWGLVQERRLRRMTAVEASP